MIHHRLPYPLHSGMDKVRYNLIRSLSTRHRVTLVVPITTKTSRVDIQQVENICARLVAVLIPDSMIRYRTSTLFRVYRWYRFVVLQAPMYTVTEYYRLLHKRIGELAKANHDDIIQVTSNFASMYLQGLDKKKVVIGPMDDYIEAARSNRAVARTFKEKVIWSLQERARRHYEPMACRSSLRVFLHSPEDLERFSKSAGGLPNARLLPTPVELDENHFNYEESLKSIKSNMILFVGGFGSAFNVDAVAYFYEHIFSIIRKEIPGVHFTIVGQKPPRRITELAQDPSITVTGTVPDVLPYIDQAAVYVAPIRAGTGFKTKIVEAMARGKAIVALPEGVQGLWDLGENAIRIAQDPASFAREVVTLLKNDTLRREIGFNARKLFEKSYTFEAVTPMILKEYDYIEQELSGRKSINMQ